MSKLRRASSRGLSLMLLMSAHRVYAQPAAPVAPRAAASDPAASSLPPLPVAAPHVPVLTAPSLKAHGEAAYPADALAARLEGTVALELSLDETGKVVSAKVTTPAGHGFDESAMAAARDFLFEPARQDGVAIKSSVQFSYEFHLPKPPPPRAAIAPSPRPLVVLQTGASQTTLVVGKRSPNGELEHVSAADSVTDHTELGLVPKIRAEGMLEVVPGLFSVQHAGGGKAQQYFLRGFDDDHGTDLAFSVDGTPVNAVSHAHGQGFSDLHFLIPEVVDTIESTKGPYATRVGDFATSGSVSFHMADHLDESFGRIEIGTTGHQRLVAVESPDLGPDWRMAVAAEAFHEDGPFIHPENYDRFNGYLKATRKFEDKSELSVMLMAYGGSWSMSGVLPARAVCGESDGTRPPTAYSGDHCISRWDSIDPSQGGESDRVELSTTYRKWFGAGGQDDLEATVYVLHSSLELFPNDGIASDVLQPGGGRYGSQVEQDDSRVELGANVRISHKSNVAGIPVVSTVGLQLRDDMIDSELHRDEQRVRLDGMPGIGGPITDSAINETELGAYAEEDFRPAKWLRFVTGARFDRIDVGVSNESQTAVLKPSGYFGAQQVSPKASMIITPVKELDLFANYGRGFHSNDARTLSQGPATTLISTATGYETGATIRPFKGLSLAAVAFLLDIQSELTIDGDTASTTPSGPTQRYGGEFNGRYDFDHRFFADASFTVAHSRYTDPTDSGEATVFVPLAPIRTFSAGVGAHEPIGHGFTLTGSIRTRSMSDRAATQCGMLGATCPLAPPASPTQSYGLTATGFTMFDASAGVRWKNVEVLFQLLNLGNVLWREGQFAVDSRLPLEGGRPPTGISFTPGIPRTLLANATVYW